MIRLDGQLLRTDGRDDPACVVPALVGGNRSGAECEREQHRRDLHVGVPHLMVAWLFVALAGRLVALEELLVVLHLAPLLRALRVEAFHLQLLLWGELREVADERDQVPARALALLAAVSPGGHPGEANAVLDDVEQLTVRELLRLGQPQIRRPWIEVAAHLRLPAPVVRVAEGAMVRKVGTASSPRLVRGRHRVAKLWKEPGMPSRRNLPATAASMPVGSTLALIPPRSSRARPPTVAPSTRTTSTA